MRLVRMGGKSSVLETVSAFSLHILCAEKNTCNFGKRLINYMFATVTEFLFI